MLPYSRIFFNKHMYNTFPKQKLINVKVANTMTRQSLLYVTLPWSHKDFFHDHPMLRWKYILWLLLIKINFICLCTVLNLCVLEAYQNAYSGRIGYS